MKLDTRSTHPAKKTAASSRPTRPSLSREDATLGSSCTTSPDHVVSLPEARTASRSNTIVACPCRDAAVTVTTSSTTSTTQGDEKNDVTIVVICPTAAGYLAAAQKQQQRLDDISVVDDDEGNDADDEEEWAAESFDPDAVPIRLGSSRLRTGSWRGDDFVRESGCASAPTQGPRRR